MTGNTLGWVIVAFVLYLLMMIAIGAFYAKGNNNSEDYFLGGRKLNGFVAALSAQASDMSGWLLMGLPGAIYLTGVGGDGWIAIGLFIGTTLNWLFIATKLRRYTIRANNSVTLPTYFENRFHDEKKVLMTVSSITIVVFFLVYCASALSAGGQLFESVFGIDYHVALTIGALVVLVYTFLGGFTAVCVTDFIQGMLMLVGILAVPLFAYHFLTTGGTTLSAGLEASGADSANFLNLMKNGDGSNNIVSVISGLGWGLGYFGMPHILVRFMAVRDEKEMTKSKATAISWVALSLGFAVFIGILGRAYLPELVNGNNEKVFIEMIKKVFTVEMRAPFIAGLFLCGILAAIMSTADSQLLVSASSVAEDIFKGLLKKDADDCEPYHSTGSSCAGLYHRMESEQHCHGTGVQCMGRLRCRFRATGSDVLILEENQLPRRRGRYCHRSTCRYHLGLHPSRGRTDPGQSYRIVFPGSRLRAGTYRYHRSQPHYQGSFRGNAAGVRGCESEQTVIDHLRSKY